MASTTPRPALLSSLPDLQDFVLSILQPATLYIDLEGRSLSRSGTLSILTIFVHETQVLRLVDVQTLGSDAFNAGITIGKSLKGILEDRHTRKYLWDVRNDADALWAYYKVRLSGVTDVQLVENASRPSDKTYVRGLDTCVEKDLGLKFAELQRWTRTKREVKALMAQDVFTPRPLSDKVMQYCANDVLYLPALQRLYAQKISSEWMKKVIDESARRVFNACSPEYQPQSETKKLGPWGSGSDKKTLTIDEFIELWDDERMDAM